MIDVKCELQDGLRRIADLADREHLRDVNRLQTAVWDYRPVERIPVVMHGLKAPDWPLFPYKETFDNPEKMLWNQLYEPYVGTTVRDDRMLTVRPNFWTANIPSHFGFHFKMDETTTWIQACHDADAIRRLIDRGVPDVTSGLARRAIEIFAIYRDHLAEAGLADVVHLFQPDNQGPFDCAYAMSGEEILTAMYDTPELVHRFLDLLSETTIAYVRAMKRAMREPADHMYHWWYRVPGGVRIVDDSTIMLSPEMYDEFSRPYTERIYAAFGGGYMHYCGHGLQSQHQRVATRGLRGIEMGSAEVGSKNPHYVLNDLWKQAAEHRVVICWIGPPGLPVVRPDIDTGLIYGHIERDVPWGQAAQRTRQIKDFWQGRKRY